MPPVTVLILHARPAPDAGPLERFLDEARATLAERHAASFREAGAEDVRLVAGPPDALAFGVRLGRSIHGVLADSPGPAGLVVLGAGSIPLARPADLRALVAAAASRRREALANNRYSADVVAIARIDRLPRLPALPSDNVLPRWLDEVAGWRVEDLARRAHLQFDIDSPGDLALLGQGPVPVPGADDPRLELARSRGAAVAAVLADRRSEVVVAGRTNARALRLLERRAAARIRAFVEERGLRASSALAHGTPAADAGGPGPRPPISLLGLLLDREGPAAFGSILARLGEAAIVDTRVLLAHRLGADESAWPAAEDRFASDLLDDASVGDPWLQALTRSAREAPVPVLLGGHTLVGPGIRLLLAEKGSGGRRPTKAPAPAVEGPNAPDSSDAPDSTDIPGTSDPAAPTG